MKSVTIKDRNGTVIIKVVHRKSGFIDFECLNHVDSIVEVRDNQNCKHVFDTEEDS